VSNEARHRDIAAVRAKGLIRAQKQPLVAMAIESNMPNGQLYPAEHLLAAGSVRAKNDHQSTASSVEPVQRGGDQ